MFKALVLEAGGDQLRPKIRQLDDDALPAGDVTVAVAYSGLNFKDAMVLTNRGNLVRSYPHVPGIDLAGTVEASDHPDFQPGDAVLLNGWRVGEHHWGGLAGKARVKGEWLQPLPDGLSLQHAMAMGTAGLAAMLGLRGLQIKGVSVTIPHKEAVMEHLDRIEDSMRLLHIPQLRGQRSIEEHHH